MYPYFIKKKEKTKEDRKHNWFKSRKIPNKQKEPVKILIIKPILKSYNFESLKIFY